MEFTEAQRQELTDNYGELLGILLNAQNNDSRLKIKTQIDRTNEEIDLTFTWTTHTTTIETKISVQALENKEQTDKVLADIDNIVTKFGRSL